MVRASLVAFVAAVFWLLPTQSAHAAFVGLGQAGGYSIFTVSNSQWSMNNSVISGPMAAGPGVTYNWAGGAGPYGGPVYYQTGNVAVPPVANLGGSPDPTAIATNLTQAVLDARAAATSAAGLVANGSVAGNKILNGTGTINLSAGENVINLTDVSMTNGTVLLNGGVNDTVIFRVSGEFSVGNSSIRVTGGLTPNHVLWYFPNSSTIKSPNGAWDGTILALSSSVSFDNTPSGLGANRGAIIAADDVNNNQTWSVTSVSGFDLVTQPFTTVPEPASALLLGAAMGALGLMRPRRMRGAVAGAGTPT
jgi:choice-of-anchor A domain-containing protein